MTSALIGASGIVMVITGTATAGNTKIGGKRTTTIVMGTIGNMTNIIKNRVKNIIATKAMIMIR